MKSSQFSAAKKKKLGKQENPLAVDKVNLQVSRKRNE